MKKSYSIIIPFRDREEHLQILLPQLHTDFTGTNYEIIVAEQTDNFRFKKSSLFNLAIPRTDGDILVFHDVDYVNSRHIKNSYFHTEPTDKVAFLPVRTVVFVDEHLIVKHKNDIPSGYRHFKDGVDNDFFGGVIMMTRNMFDSIGGFNPYYNGWGLEDADARERILLNGFEYVRGVGDFMALSHTDSNPGLSDAGFMTNQILFNNRKELLKIGSKNTTGDVKKVDEISGIKWLKISNMGMCQ